MLTSNGFPQPTLISVNGVELKCLKPEKKTLETRSYFVTAGRRMPFAGGINCQRLRPLAITSSCRTSVGMAILHGRLM